MVTPVNSSSPRTKTSIFYINDIHGTAGKMGQVKSAANQFDTYARENPQIDALKLCAGDTLIGLNDRKNNNAIDFLNAVKFDAMTLGNHDMDDSIFKAVDYYKRIKTPILATNMKMTQPHAVQNELVQSTVIEMNGHRYGILGTQPLDFDVVMTAKDWRKYIHILPLDETIKKLQAEVDKFTEQGIDRIILISHSGFSAEQAIAQKTHGIDVIIGGHSHDLVEGVEKGKNLFSSQNGEPVVLTQAYKNGKYFGVLNLEFDEKGRIVSAQNNVTSTTKYPRDLLMTYFANKNLGTPKVIGRVLNKVQLPLSDRDTLLQENPYANLITDAMRSELDTDIALLNTSNIRGTLPVGELTDRNVSEITPFDNKMLKIEISQKDLVDALKLSGKSFSVSDGKPGLLQASGVRYTMDKNGELKSAEFIDKQGQKHPINIDAPDKDITYTVAIDDYYGSGSENFSMLNKIDNALAVYDFDKDKLTIDYIKKLNKPIEIKADGRITII